MTKTRKYHPGQPRQISLFQAHKYHDTLKLRLIRNSWEQPVFSVAGQNKQFVCVRLKTRFVVGDFGWRAKAGVEFEVESDIAPKSVAELFSKLED